MTGWGESGGDRRTEPVLLTTEEALGYAARLLDERALVCSLLTTIKLFSDRPGLLERMPRDLREQYGRLAVELRDPADQVAPCRMAARRIRDLVEEERTIRARRDFATGDRGSAR